MKVITVDQILREVRTGAFQMIDAFFVSARVFGGNINDNIPKFAIKYNPIPLFLEYDLHYQFVGEYFIDAKQSVQFTYGFGNHRILENSENDKMSMFRFEYKRFFRPFNTQKKARGYWGPEIMYKRALVPEDASPAIGFNLPPYPRHFFVNVAAFHLKLGREHIDLKNFPVFEAFFGAGVRGFNNFFGLYTIFWLRKRLSGVGNVWQVARKRNYAVCCYWNRLWFWKMEKVGFEY